MRIIHDEVTWIAAAKNLRDDEVLLKEFKYRNHTIYTPTSCARHVPMFLPKPDNPRRHRLMTRLEAEQMYPDATIVD